MKEQNKGITLVALAITIIVLLILAAVGIKTLIGDNGIVDVTQTAKKQAERQSLIEEIQQEVVDKMKDRKGSFKEGDLYSVLNKYFSNIPEVPESADAENPWNTYPQNFPNQTGILIPREEYGDFDDIKTTEIYDKPFAKEIEVASTPGKPGDDGIFTENSTVDGNPPSSENPVIPKGFKPLDTDTSNWSNPEENVDKGLVIEDVNHNQFVWVPVPIPSEMFDTSEGRNVGKLYEYSSSKATEKTYTDIALREPSKLKKEDLETLKYVMGLEGSDDEVLAKWQQQLQDDFDAMERSVSKYKGFWIGRYETGNLDPYEVTVPVISSMNDKVQSGNFYGNYVSCKKFAEEKDGIISSMCWGSQWDATLNWFIRCGGDVAQKVFSRGYGNFSATKFTYKKADGTEVKKDTLMGAVLPTGCTEYSKMNNIYDMAGNVDEYTVEEGADDTRTMRGGHCGMSNGSVSGRATDRKLGSRTANSQSGPLNAGTRTTMFIEEN